jgi:putative transposase
VPARVSPTERIRAEIDQLCTTDQDLGQILEEVARLGARLLLQAALEAEVTQFLGRDRDTRGERVRPGHRNGHAPATVKTTAGPVTLERPTLRGTDQAFASRLLGKGVTRTSAVESLVIAGFVRGLSVRDVEASLAEALGPEAALPKSTVGRVCEQIKDEFQAWTTPSLADVALEDLFLDGSHFKMAHGARAEPVLVAWASPPMARRCWSGWLQAAPRAMMPGPGSWPGWSPAGCGRRCWSSPTAPRAHRRGRAGLDRSLRQRCLIHRARNVLAKVPAHAQDEVKAAYWAIFDDIEQPPGRQAVAEAQRRGQTFADRYQRVYPAAVACLLDLRRQLHHPSRLEEVVTEAVIPAA